MHERYIPSNSLRVFLPVLFLLSVMLFGVACAKVSQQAVILSNTVGERIADMEASHQAFVSAYFRLSRDRVEDFLTQRWISTFLGIFVRKAELMDKLEKVEPLTEEQKGRLIAELQKFNISGDIQSAVLQAVNSALGDPDRGQLVLQFSQAAMKEIENKRKSLLVPINEMEGKTLEELRKAYAQLKQAQSTVTAHLSSIRKVTEEQDRVLERLRLLRQRDQIIEKVITANQTIMGILDAGKDAAATLSELESRLETTKGTQ